MAEDERAHERIDMLRDALMDARMRLAALEAEVRELRALVTPLDAGSQKGGDPR